MADHPGTHTPTAKDFTDLFPGAGGALLKGSGLANRLTKDISNQATRGIGGPPAVNTGIQSNPASFATEAPDVFPTSKKPPTRQDLTGAVPQHAISPPDLDITPIGGSKVPLNKGTLTAQKRGGNLGAGSTGSPLNDELRRRLRKDKKQF